MKSWLAFGVFALAASLDGSYILSGALWLAMAHRVLSHAAKEESLI